MIKEQITFPGNTESIERRRIAFMNQYENQLLTALKSGSIVTSADLRNFDSIFLNSIADEQRDIAWINHKQAIYDIELRLQALGNFDRLNMLEPKGHNTECLELALTLLTAINSL